MKERKISFLIAAHNEEKIIDKTLANLLNLPYKNYEVILGLDGCTDKTEEIVKKFVNKSKKFKYYKLAIREGKPAVVNEIIKKATGDIVIINDADWIFSAKDEKSLKKYLSLLDDPKIGGICENLPLEWNSLSEKNDLGYKMVAWSSYLWYEYQKKKFAKKKHDYLIVKEPVLFMTNIFRKNLYKDNSSLGDDFERTQDIMDAGYLIAIPLGKDDPKMKPVYDKIPIRELFNQKVRTAMARDQINQGRKKKINIKNYYLPTNFYIFLESWKKGMNIGLLISGWIAITAIATLWLSLKKFDTKKGWTMRVKR